MKRIITIYFLILSFVIIDLSVLAFASDHQRGSFYAVATKPTPVLNNPDFKSVFGGEDGVSLQHDKQGLLRALEFIAFTDTVFQVVAIHPLDDTVIYKVETSVYPYPSKTGYFIDERFVKLIKYCPPERSVKLLSEAKIIGNLRKKVDVGLYVWGGNYSAGIPEMLDYYPPRTPVSNSQRRQWILKGLDCSGLLYDATDGYTPRNTSELVSYGISVPVAGKSADQIAGLLKPLDIIVWSGHVIIVLDKEHVIESRFHYDSSIQGRDSGVRIRQTEYVLSELMRTRKPVNIYDKIAGPNQFVVRRWYQQK